MRAEPIRSALPLVLVALMLGIAVALELALFERTLWAPKLPLALLLVVAFLCARHDRGAR